MEVDRVLHSGKTRAGETAESLAEALRPVPRVHAAEDLDPLSDPQVWEAFLAKSQEGLMLVGHLPHLAKLAALLLCGEEGTPVIAFQNGGILCLERGDGGAWSVRWMVVPSIV